LGLALLLAHSEANEDMSRMFLDSMFRWELHRRCVVPKQSELQAWRAVEMLLTSLLDPQSAVGCKLLMVTAKAIGQAESDLDALVEAQAETLLSYCGQGYEATARQRSAAEFIRRRLADGLGRRPSCSGVMKALDSAIESLDQTIRGYDQEGYTLACPQLVGFRSWRRIELPYEHWWVRLDGPIIGRPRALAMCN